MSFSLDTSLLLQNVIGSNGLHEDQLLSTEYNQAYSSVTDKLKIKEYGFVSILEQVSLLEEYRNVFEKISWAKQLVVVGIGGSDLGGRMLQQALQSEHPPMEVIFAGDTTDPNHYNQLLKRLDLQHTVVNIISKSGSTTETAAAYAFLKSVFRQHFNEDWKKHFVFTTDEKEGTLRSEANALNILTLSVPGNVGGRFSVLSAVGLFPALAMGIDIEALVAGARNAADKISLTQYSDNPSWHIALSHYLFQKEKNINTVVLMPYVMRLELFAVWFRQLWAESLGKEGKGILPIKAIGPADQHSQVQFYNQGKWLSTFMFIAANHYGQDISLDVKDSNELRYLDGIPFERIIKAECEATRYSLANNGRPSALITIDQVDAPHVGSLIILFELGVVYLAELLGVNAFDQPGVEEGKQYMYGLLGKPGFAEKAEEIKEIQEKSKGKIITI